MSPDDALSLIASSKDLYVAKGKKVVHFDLSKGKRPDDEEILSHIMGPTGNLRAPTLKVGSAVLVGFEENMYSDVVKKILAVK